MPTSIAKNNSVLEALGAGQFSEGRLELLTKLFRIPLYFWLVTSAYIDIYK